jgi:hypothetical protein
VGKLSVRCVAIRSVNIPSDGIVPTVALSAHARLQVIRAIEAPPRIAAVLGALIGINQRAARSASPHRHQHGLEHELAVNRPSRRPLDNQAREQIQDDGQIQIPATCECR